jgi:hypothetical protein
MLEKRWATGLTSYQDVILRLDHRIELLGGQKLPRQGASKHRSAEKA